ncbi:MAG: hypothetical protein GKS06_08825 [Acidobacteria bacterium]|nr:hypothetical protein [Acidobacteriota bacterium]
MDKFDDALREALGDEERKVWDELVDPTPLQMAGDLFRSRLRWFHVVAAIEALVALGLGVWTLSKFLAADEALTALRWGLAFVGCAWALWAIKMWSWLQMQRYALTRELKRLELQVVHLSTRIDATVGEGEPS